MAKVKRAACCVIVGEASPISAESVGCWSLSWHKVSRKDVAPNRPQRKEAPASVEFRPDGDYHERCAWLCAPAYWPCLALSVCVPVSRTHLALCVQPACLRVVLHLYSSLPSLHTLKTLYLTFQLPIFCFFFLFPFNRS